MSSTFSKKKNVKRTRGTSRGVAWVNLSKSRHSKIGQGLFYLLFSVLLLAFLAGCGYAGYAVMKNGGFASLGGILAPGVADAEPAPKVYTSDPARPPQFVVFSFDGSYSLEMWDETLDFAKDARRRNAPVDFTYFISGVYFLAPENAAHYQAPLHEAGQSGIGFADGLFDIGQRVDKINRAIREGHEIGSHANGHFDGSKWSVEDWTKEHDSFNDLLFNIQKNNPGLTKKYLALNPEDIVGFRAPELGVNKNVYQSLQSKGFRYDASGIGGQKQWPKKDQNAIWHYPLVALEVGENRAPVLSIDYSLYHFQSGVKDVATRNSETWRKFHQDLYAAYMTYFTNNYESNRAPVVIANHFSKWNDGVYWEVMQRFALSVCGQPEVHCVTFKELTDYMDTLTPEQLARFQKGDFPKLLQE